MGEGAVDAVVVAFLGSLPLAATILELGCGAGNHSAEMLARGFRVRATDGSPEQPIWRLLHEAGV